MKNQDVKRKGGWLDALRFFFYPSEFKADVAAQIATGPDQAMALIKDLCRQAPRNTLEQQLELEALYMPLSQETEESREGINAFLEKRAPDFAKLRSSKPG